MRWVALLSIVVSTTAYGAAPTALRLVRGELVRRGREYRKPDREVRERGAGGSSRVITREWLGQRLDGPITVRIVESRAKPGARSVTTSANVQREHVSLSIEEKLANRRRALSVVTFRGKGLAEVTEKERYRNGKLVDRQVWEAVPNGVGLYRGAHSATPLYAFHADVYTSQRLIDRVAELAADRSLTLAFRDGVKSIEVAAGSTPKAVFDALQAANMIEIITR